MKLLNRPLLLASISALLGAALSAALLLSQKPPTDQATESAEQKPLYWVAPMDPNYQRDEPGQSPMGMDLLPVYAAASSMNGSVNSSAAAEGPGTIFISPNVVNNLGVRTALVEMRPMASEILTVGYVQYDQDRLVHIHPRVEGWIESLYVKTAGDPVEKGQPLYKIYSPQLASAQDELVLALNRDNDVLVKAAEDRLRSLQLDNQFIAELKQSRKVQQNITFNAPQTGVVDNLNIREGFYVQPGTTLMSLAALDEVWVEAEIFERQASMIELDLPVTMRLDYLPGRSWQGVVDFIYPSLDSKTRTLKVRLRFANADSSLKPNMFAQVRISTANNDSALMIANEAVIRTGHQNRVVLALGEGQYKSVAVTLGRMDSRFTEILSGLVEGEQIVISAQFLLDSESSKTSDFMRMDHQQGMSMASNADSAEPKTTDSLWVESTVEEIMADTNMVKLTHAAIEQWGWPVMTMMFAVEQQVDLNTLRPGMSIHAQIDRGETKDAKVIAIHILEQPIGDGMELMQMDEGQMNHD